MWGERIIFSYIMVAFIADPTTWVEILKTLGEEFVNNDLKFVSWGSEGSGFLLYAIINVFGN